MEGVGHLVNTLGTQVPCGERLSWNRRSVQYVSNTEGPRLRPQSSEWFGAVSQKSLFRKRSCFLVHSFGLAPFNTKPGLWPRAFLFDSIVAFH